VRLLNDFGSELPSPRKYVEPLAELCFIYKQEVRPFVRLSVFHAPVLCQNG